MLKQGQWIEELATPSQHQPLQQQQNAVGSSFSQASGVPATAWDSLVLGGLAARIALTLFLFILAAGVVAALVLGGLTESKYNDLQTKYNHLLALYTQLIDAPATCTGLCHNGLNANCTGQCINGTTTILEPSFGQWYFCGAGDDAPNTVFSINSDSTAWFNITDTGNGLFSTNNSTLFANVGDDFNVQWNGPADTWLTVSISIAFDLDANPPTGLYFQVYWQDPIIGYVADTVKIDMVLLTTSIDSTWTMSSTARMKVPADAILRGYLFTQAPITVYFETFTLLVQQ